MARTSEERRGDSTEMGEELEEKPNKRARTAENSTLPLVSVIDDQPTMDLAKEILKEAAEIKARMDKDAVRMSQLRADLGVVMEAYGLSGVRFDKMGFEYRGERCNRTLDKALLIENGVSAKQISDSYKDGKPFVDCRFVALA